MHRTRAALIVLGLSALVFAPMPPAHAETFT